MPRVFVGQFNDHLRLSTQSHWISFDLKRYWGDYSGFWWLHSSFEARWGQRKVKTARCDLKAVQIGARSASQQWQPAHLLPIVQSLYWRPEPGRGSLNLNASWWLILGPCWRFKHQYRPIKAVLANAHYLIRVWGSSVPIAWSSVVVASEKQSPWFWRWFQAFVSGPRKQTALTREK